MNMDDYDDADRSLWDIARQITDEVLGEGTYDNMHLNNPNPHVQTAIQKGLNFVRHTPMAVHVPKMDTPTGLYAGFCSCGWRGNGLGSERQAIHDAKQHARAKNTRAETDADRQRQRSIEEKAAIESITRTVQERSKK